MSITQIARITFVCSKRESFKTDLEDLHLEHLLEKNTLNVYIHININAYAHFSTHKFIQKNTLNVHKQTPMFIVFTQCTT